MMKKAVPFVLICLTQAGCSFIDSNPIYGEEGVIRDRSQDYQESSEAKALNVPAGLNAKPIEDKMVIPEVASVATIQPDEFSVPRPIFFYPQSTSNKVGVAREEGEKRVVVDESKALVFATLKDFWHQNDVDIASANVETGELETGWIVAQTEGEQSFIDRWLNNLNLASGSINQRDKFRLEVSEVAGNPDRTSIALAHARSYSTDESVTPVWDGEAGQLSYKSEVMFEMLRYLSNEVESDHAPTLSELKEQEQIAPAQVLGRDSRGQPVLKLEGNVDEAWAQVHKALKTERFDLGTVDRKQGIFYLTYVAKVKVSERRKMGFFEWLHSDRGDIKFGSTAIGNALGFSDTIEDEGIRYSSKLPGVVDTETGEVLDLPPGATAEEVRQARLKASDGFKIWMGDQVLYVFGDADANKGVYNEDISSYEFMGRYQLRMTRTRAGVYLNVWDDQGLDAPVAIAEELLWDIKDRL